MYYRRSSNRVVQELTSPRVTNGFSREEMYYVNTRTYLDFVQQLIQLYESKAG